MHTTNCWLCTQSFEYDGEQYRDINCPHCKILNSIYNPNKPDWQPDKPMTTHDEWLQKREEQEMKPPKREGKDYEKVKIGEMIPGVIMDINYDKEHTFKGFQGADDTKQMGVRFKFSLDGYQHPHYSRWLKFSYAEKSNLYKTFISKLVENPTPDMDLDLDLLKNMKVKTLWNENGDFQNLESIFPAGNKVKATDPLPTEEIGEEIIDEAGV